MRPRKKKINAESRPEDKVFPAQHAGKVNRQKRSNRWRREAHVKGKGREKEKEKSPTSQCEKKPGRQKRNVGPTAEGCAQKERGEKLAAWVLRKNRTHLRRSLPAGRIRRQAQKKR